jgi:hypothetical protein
VEFSENFLLHLACPVGKLLAVLGVPTQKTAGSFGYPRILTLRRSGRHY